MLSGAWVDTAAPGVAISSNVVIDRGAFPSALAADAYRAGNAQSILDLSALARTRMLAGGGEVAFLANASGNGKSAMQESRMDCIELFTACDKALGIYQALVLAGADPLGGAAVSCTYADFSGLSGCPGGLHRLF